MVAHIVAIETSPLLTHQKTHRSHRTLVLLLVAAIVFLVPLRPIILNFSVTKPQRPFEPIAGAFAFAPSDYSNVVITVKHVTPDVSSSKTLLSANLMVDSGSSETSHVAFTISSSTEPFQIASNVSAHIENHVLTITLYFNDEAASTSFWALSAKKNPWLHISARITLPQPTIESFVFSSPSPSIDASLSWETGTQVATNFYAYTGSHHGGTITLSPPAPLSARLLHVSTHKADIISTVPLSSEHLTISSHDGSIATDKLHASTRAKVMCTGSGLIRGKVHATPELQVWTNHGNVELEVDHVETGDKNHWTRVKSVSGHVGVQLVGFEGAYVAESEEGAVKVVEGGSRGKEAGNSGVAAGGAGKVGWVGRKEGKGKVEVNSQKGNVRLTFLK
ncbi:hypothetical protein HDU98_009383 [Podochytrium sp. JEL0797]|nr:hypothetical protein HDU98_009383 [Podochytrium sp. JEL0797]